MRSGLAPANKPTSHRTERWASSRVSRSTSGVTSGGDVLGIARMHVKPPASAAAVPLAKVLLVLAARHAQMGMNVDQAGKFQQISHQLTTSLPYTTSLSHYLTTSLH